MNREIKFRAWHTGNKVMMPNKSLSVLAKNIKDDKIWKYMQFTGLYDKNGNPIYEGDILCVSHLENTRHKVRLVVEWDEKRAGWSDFSPRGAFEVIGNIYQTPNILND